MSENEFSVVLKVYRLMHASASAYTIRASAGEVGNVFWDTAHPILSIQGSNLIENAPRSISPARISYIGQHKENLDFYQI